MMHRERIQIYLDILYQGLLNCRDAGSRDDAAQCAAEADHLHNLPSLIRNQCSEPLHEFYWRIERPCYIAKSKPEYAGRFTSLWDELGQS